MRIEITPILGCTTATATVTLALALAFVPPSSSQLPEAAVVDRSVPAEIDGVERNGTHLSRTELNGVGDVYGPMTADSGSLGDDPLYFIEAQGGEFVARMEVDGEMVPLSGVELFGARLALRATVVSSTGKVSSEKLTVDIVDITDGDGLEGSGQWAYHLLVYDPDTISWMDPCPDNDGKGLIPLRGGWDPVTGDYMGDFGITLACRGDVLAKCVEWGYKPWLSPEHAELHQACTRMARADYCGDGTAHTIDGTKIDVLDALNVQQAVTEWPVEAEWGPQGATCLGTEDQRMDQPGVDQPECLTELEQLPECGELDGTSMLASRYGT